MRMKSRVKWLALITFLVLSFPLISLGQEEGGEGREEESSEESAEEESEEKESKVEVKESFSDRLVAAAWCPIQKKRPPSASISTPDENEEEEERATSESDPIESGCDKGIGVSLWSSNRFPKVFIAGAVGLKSVALGLGWLAYSGDVTIAVAFGLMAPFDGKGIYLGEVEPAIGATFGF